MRSRAPSVVGGIAALLILGGCGSVVDEPRAPGVEATRSSPTVGATAEEKPGRTTPPSTGPTPTATPTTDPHPALADLVIATTGLGPLTVGGVPPADNPGAAMIEWDADFCGGGPDEVADPGRWVPSGYDQDTGYTGDPVTPFYVEATDAGVHRLDVMGGGPATAAGIRIGSTVDELRAAYPALDGPVDGPVSRVWVIHDASGSVAFETQGDADGLRPAGTVESVILIRVLESGYPADFAAANSGNVAGACF